MGRKKKNYPESSETRHRFADTKYRQNIQYLYGLLKEDTYENSTKDVLLYEIASDIQKMHDDIINFAGPQKLMKFEEDFKRLVEMGEIIWKKEKNPIFWWSRMQEVLKSVMNNETIFVSTLDSPLTTLHGIRKRRRNVSVL